MGDAAELMLDGTLDDMGEYIDGKSPGYPRPRHFNKPDVALPNHISRIRTIVKELKIYKKWHHVAHDYRKTPANKRSLDTRSLQKLARGICNEFSTFETYCKTLITKTDEQTN